MRSMLLVAFAAASLISSVAIAKTAQDIVADQGNHVLQNTFNNCVRTKWDAGKDVCAAELPKPKPAPVAVVVPAPARALSKEARSVYFDFNKAGIVASEATKLDSLSSVLKADKTVKSVRIVGYADRIGKPSYNQALSQKRAQSVEAYLRQKGYLSIAGAETRWLGDTAPKANCDDKLKRAKKIACLREDRRVEVEIDYLQ